MPTVIESVLAAKAEIEAKYAAQTRNGVPLSPAQEAESLIAQIQAVLAAAAPAPAKPAAPAAAPAGATQ